MKCLLLTNTEPIAINLFAHGPNIVWVSDAAGSQAKYLGVFNVGEQQDGGIDVRWKDLGISDECTLRDLWAKKDIGKMQGGYRFKLAPHASGLYRVTNSSR